MEELAVKLDLLGFDLAGLEDVVYSSGIVIPPVTCQPNGSCEMGCSGGCAQCYPGCQIGKK